MLPRKTTLVAALLILIGLISIVAGTISYASGMEALENPLALGPDSTTLSSLEAGVLAGLGCLAVGFSLTGKSRSRDD